MQRNEHESRLPLLDMARGLAVVAMVAFHFCYDLEYFQVVNFHIKEAVFWTTWRDVIVSSFIFMAGMSLYLSSLKQPGFVRHLKNQKWLLGCALLVSAGTYPLFPRSWIHFGVLHFILAARIIGFAFTRFHFLIPALGIGALWAGMAFQSEVFNPKWINWIGFTTRKPFTEDYVPLFPWLGVFFLGMFAGKQLFGRKSIREIFQAGRSHGIARGLAFVGRHSLIIYMVHQPVIMALMASALYLF